MDRAVGVPLSTLAFEGPEDQLTATQNAQPALLAHGAAVWAMTKDRLAPHIRASAGHSLGEFTAYHAAGSLSLGDAVTVVRRRGELMYDSGLKRPGAMAAILGLDEAQVEEACRRASVNGAAVVPANYNTPEQLVISGESAAVDRAMELAKELGAKRAIRLKVSGAFHSPLMEVARPGLSRALDDASSATRFSGIQQRERGRSHERRRSSATASGAAHVAGAVDERHSRTRGCTSQRPFRGDGTGKRAHQSHQTNRAPAQVGDLRDNA